MRPKFRATPTDARHSAMMLRLPMQLIRYMVVGGMAASLNVCSRMVYNLWTSYSAAIVLAHITGMMTTFFLARAYVFPRGPQPAAVLAITRFCLVQGVSLLQTWLISILLARDLLPALGVLRFNHEIAHAFGVASAAFTNYFGNKYWTFRRRSGGADMDAMREAKVLHKLTMR